VGDDERDEYNQETLKKPSLDSEVGIEHAACGSINEANHSSAESPYSSGDIIHPFTSRITDFLSPTPRLRPAYYDGPAPSLLHLRVRGLF
jgi:hypothetical protein